jgi:hypothetical protein
MEAQAQLTAQCVWEAEPSVSAAGRVGCRTGQYEQPLGTVRRASITLPLK